MFHEIKNATVELSHSAAKCTVFVTASRFPLFILTLVLTHTSAEPIDNLAAKLPTKAQQVIDQLLFLFKGQVPKKVEAPYRH